MKTAACAMFLILMAPSDTDHALQLADRLLESVGGAALWRERQYAHTYAVNHHPDSRLPYTQEGWIDLDAPRHRLELCNFDMQRTRAYTQERGWGVSEGRFYEFDAARLADEHQFWRTSIYRKLRLLARGSPETTVEAAEGRIHVTHDGEYLGWIAVDAETGAPIALGNARDGQATTQFGPLEEFGEVTWLTRGAETGGWSFETISFELLSADADLEFTPSDGGERLCSR